MVTKDREKFLKRIPGRQQNLRDGLALVRDIIGCYKNTLNLAPDNYESECWRSYKNECRTSKAVLGAVKKQLSARPKYIELYPEFGGARLICNCGMESVFNIKMIINYCPYCGQRQDVSKIKKARKALEVVVKEAGEIINEVE